MPDEIEEFLRRAAEKRRQRLKGDSPAQQQPPAQQRPPAPRPQPTQAQPPVRTEPPASRTLEKSQSDVHDAHDAQGDAYAGDSVSEHVAHHIDTTRFAERGSHMAEKIGLADEKMEAHLHETFDHDEGHTLGRLGTSIGGSGLAQEQQLASDLTPETVGVDIVGQIRQMLKDPNSIRQAILLKEVLDRPEHRWSS